MALNNLLIDTAFLTFIPQTTYMQDKLSKSSSGIVSQRSIMGALVQTDSPSGILGQHSLVSQRSIMGAILQTIGPVSTCQAIRGNWKFLKSATSQQFLAAATELERLGLGRLVGLSGKGRTQQCFIKKPPGDAQALLEANPDLCEAGLYATRYHRPATKIINWGIRNKLVAMGLVSQKQFM